MMSQLSCGRRLDRAERLLDERRIRGRRVLAEGGEWAVAGRGRRVRSGRRVGRGGRFGGGRRVRRGGRFGGGCRLGGGRRLCSGCRVCGGCRVRRRSCVGIRVVVVAACGYRHRAQRDDSDGPSQVHCVLPRATMGLSDVDIASSRPGALRLSSSPDVAECARDIPGVMAIRLSPFAQECLDPLDDPIARDQHAPDDHESEDEELERGRQTE